MKSRQKLFIHMVLLLSVIAACGDPEIEAQVDLRSANSGAKTTALAAPVDGVWSQWFGPQRNGRSAEIDLHSDWSQKTPVVAWRQSLGEGFAAIVIANSRAYTQFSEGNDEFLLCSDAATGKELWRFRTGDIFAGRMGGDGPRSTPAVEDGKVYVYSTFGTLYSVNAENGSKIWHVDMVEHANGSVPQWGYSTSPLLVGDLVIVEAGGGSGKALVAVNKTSGKITWTGGSDRCGYSSPIFVTINNVPQIIAFTGTQLMGLKPDDGKVIWQTEWKTNYDVNAATPMFIAPDRIFISSEYDVGAGMYRVSGDASGMSIEQLWKIRGMKNKMSTSVYHEGAIYGFDGNVFKCIDAESGEDRWKQRGFGEGSLIYADGHLWVMGDKGTLAVVEASPLRYNEKGSAKVLDGKSWTSPAIAGGKMFVRNINEMVCLDISAMPKS